GTGQGDVAGVLDRNGVVDDLASGADAADIRHLVNGEVRALRDLDGAGGAAWRGDGKGSGHRVNDGTAAIHPGRGDGEAASLGTGLAHVELADCAAVAR